MSVKTKKPAETPLMRQYNQIKAKHPDAILLFRVGDFYETFDKDAVVVSKVLGIVLTKRKNGAAAFVDLAGFPHHSLETYLPKLVKAGYRVAVCDQLEDPKKTKTIVKRGVTELVTPGVTYNDQVLDNKSNNFLCALHVGTKEWGCAFLDVSTGEFHVTQGDESYVKNLLSGYQPSEVLINRSKRSLFAGTKEGTYYTYEIDDWVFTEDYGTEKLKEQFSVTSLKGLGVFGMSDAIIAAGAALHYLTSTSHHELAHINRIQRIVRNDVVWMDAFTIRNLELLHPNHVDGKALIDVIDNTSTSMGGRMLKKWVLFPLMNVAAIKQRQKLVNALLKKDQLFRLMMEKLSGVSDIERLASKISTGRINPREVLYLGKSFLLIHEITEALKNAGKELKEFSGEFPDLLHLYQKINDTIHDEAPALLSKGSVIKPLINKELDGYRDVSTNGKDYLLQLQKKYAEEFDIPSLKVSFNNVFGYYLEVRNTHKEKVPETWVRKQTLVNAERYITEELKELEVKILSAEEKIAEIEGGLYKEFVLSMIELIPSIQHASTLTARLDVLCSFASIAFEREYVCPEVADDLKLDIKDGRHPVIEVQLDDDHPYIPNDVFMDNDSQQVLMITGPNMAGKSAVLRQTALITLLAQAGSFVPAKFAHIGVVDKIFTRVGASDNLASGESTFMVEMNETANILHNISHHSLVLLDELGRGTSTYDGISLAWSVSEYLHENKKANPKTLFATHYHELNQMSEQFPRIKNFNVAVKEIGNQVIFLRKLQPGGSEHSFGIHVAKMAGMPYKVLQRANDILDQLESTRDKNGKTPSQSQKTSEMQLSFFQLDDPVLEQIRDEIKGLDIDTLTPVEALMKLNEIKKLVGSN